MANEVGVTITLTATKGKASIRTGGISQNFDMAGEDMMLETQNVSSSAWGALSFGGITGVPSCVFIQNIDAANYIELAEDNAGAHKIAKITFGKFNLITPSSATIYAKANTADVKIWLGATEA